MQDKEMMRQMKELQEKVSHMEKRKPLHRLLGFITAFLFVGGIMLFAASVNKPYNFSSGQVISAGEINANFNTVYEAVNANITNIDTVSNLIHATVPAGVILMWSGDASNIPTGWALCDGSSGTPNLTNRFIVGAGGSYTADETGGTADSSHTHSVSGSVSISSHVFDWPTYTVPDHYHSRGTLSINSGGAHTHSIISYYDSSRTFTGEMGYGEGSGHPSYTRLGGVVGGYDMNSSGLANWILAAEGGSHSHSLTGYIGDTAGVNGDNDITCTESGGYINNHTGSVSLTSSGASATDNRPPYYALCFIIKL